jgi:hypothetical protein
MNEPDWWGCQEPLEMLDLLRDRGQFSQRKARLFAAAVCRQVWSLLTDERSRRAVEVAERHADGLADDDELAEAGLAARSAYVYIRDTYATSGAGFPNTILVALAAAEAAMTEREAVTRLSGWKVSVEEVLRGYAAGYAANVVSQYVTRAIAYPEGTGPVALLRDIYFNPFRAKPAIAAAVLAWNDGCVVKLATGIYEEQDFSQERMGVLADALEEAGVTAEGVLGHCLQVAGHVRGCWLVDAILAKE